MKRLLSGNEAIALGIWEAGARFASAYPGTPSTEILEYISTYRGIKSEWASNEKVALDTAIGASFANVRAVACMKHVGVNVAADSLMSVSYAGVGAGLVLVSADDPGAWSSQNEQDSRHYARLGKFPCLDPADSNEAKEFTRAAFELSERFNTIVMVRSTTRISHSKSIVDVEMPAGERSETAGKKAKFIPNPTTFALIPAHARRLHPLVEERMLKLEEYAETSPLNRIEWGDRRIGVVTGSIGYQYAREVFAGYSILKLGISYPIPRRMIREFAGQVDQVIVVEELDPFWEDQIKAMGIEATGKRFFPITGELNLERVRVGALAAGLPVTPAPELHPQESIEVPPRIPALCPGCPHRAALFNIKKQRLILAGDIGCYAIGVLPPLNATDTQLSMGASIGVAHGIQQSGTGQKTVAVIGDSTFFHTGLPALANSVYNQVPITVIILDNHTTGMTGGQGNPASGLPAVKGQPAKQIDIEAVVKGMGVEWVRKIDAFDVKLVDRSIREAVDYRDGPAVVIVDGDCVMNESWQRSNVVAVDLETCNGCTLCFKVGCPAILKSDALDEKTNRPKAEIDPMLCTGCDVCLQVCPRQAIIHLEGSND
ncbi:MAG: indolepyruvate ferredoxin oxidoreductase subunit alpha [Anaerolineales bacterium]|nr:indolepyruvate ferredoxin oxidoreductase subunit alpha [Anaerolineales bacterium]